MTEDSCPKVVSSSSESDPSTTKQRKRRKWDQPDESLVSAGIAVPGIFPLANMGSLARITLPTVSSVPGASLAIPFTGSSATPMQVVQVPLQQHAAAIFQKLVQPKIPDELIAREIVINDADSAIRYKLTKRQTQEKIQKSTGAVVITRGKYRPPNAPLNGERPLYLHISAATHLETTAERIKAVDLAAAMVEEMLKQATVSSGVKVDQLLSTCVFLGFEADPSFNIVSRIRGPYDQYVNHIMNETGANVLLRGRGSGYSENGKSEETQPPLHLLLSSKDPRSLEHAKLLAENLLDTICSECGSSRVSSCKVYGAVPPPTQLQAGVHSPGIPAGVSSVASLGSLSQAIGMSNPVIPQVNSTCYPHGLTCGTSYVGYGGLYPQATPLQQVALALKQSTSPVTATVAPATIAANTELPKEVPSAAKDKRFQKRKFQELPAVAKGPANLNQKNIQGSAFPMPRELTSHVGARDNSVVQDSKQFTKPSFNGMAPPPPRILPPSSVPSSNGMAPPPPRVLPTSSLPSSNGMAPPPPRVLQISSLPSSNGMAPPPKRLPASNSPPKVQPIRKVHGDNNGMQGSKSEIVPDTLIKLMEYGDDDDDDVDDDLEETAKIPLENHSSCQSIDSIPKPFWAV